MTESALIVFVVQKKINSERVFGTILRLIVKCASIPITVGKWVATMQGKFFVGSDDSLCYQKIRQI